MSVLIVDDEGSVRQFVDRALREAGYTTTVASDGPEAIKVAATLDPLDILVTDLMMPAPAAAVPSGPEGAVPHRVQRSIVQGENDPLGR